MQMKILQKTLPLISFLFLIVHIAAGIPAHALAQGTNPVTFTISSGPNPSAITTRWNLCSC
jgi:hypothetical protein